MVSKQRLLIMHIQYAACILEDKIIHVMVCHKVFYF